MALQFPQINWNMLSQMGDNIAELGPMWRERQLRGALSDAFAKGTPTYDDLIGIYSKFEPNMAARMAWENAQAKALAGYRAESLKPEAVREYEYLYGPTSSPTTPQAPGTAVESGSSAPPTKPSLAEYKLNRTGGTPAEQTVDREFGKEYVDWRAKGGYSYTKRQINQLDSAVKDTEAAINDPKEGYEGITGPWAKLIPDFAEGFLNPKGRLVKQKVEEAIQSSLRAVLGAQYTQVEGENLLRRTWDPSLDEAENVKRVRSVMHQLDDMAKAKESAAQYYEQNGTLRGWKGPSLSIDSIDPGIPTGQEIAVSVPGKNTDRYTNDPTAAEAGAAPGTTTLDDGTVIEGTTPDPAGSYFNPPPGSGSEAVANIQRAVKAGTMTRKQAIDLINKNKDKWGVEVDESR